MPTVFANGRSILHSGDGNTHVAAPPDVCKIPTPGGPVPTPFVNSASDSMLSKGAKKTKIEGNPVAIADSELSTSTGDEPGTLGGLISSKFKGKLTWNGASTDVKVEGKGVCRFMDPTAQNGNTFNTAFISVGGTGLAYGDDAPCDVCGKGIEKHRVLETGAAFDSVEIIFTELENRFKPQRTLIEEFIRLQQECGRVVQDADRRADTEEPKRKELEERVKNLTALLKTSTDKAASGRLLGQAQTELAAKKAEIKKIRADSTAANAERRARMTTINAEILAMPNVLIFDDGSKTYTKGYMVGVCICKCAGKPPKQIAGCSGTASPGFTAAVRATPFTSASSFTMSENQLAKVTGMIARKERGAWECAAPKLMQAGGVDGHKVKTLSERWYAPAGGMVSVSYSRTEGKTTIAGPETFAHGESVPSCEACQVLVPEMLCDNEKECL
jgi:hypothetical protein